MSINLKTQIRPELLKVTELTEVKQYNLEDISLSFFLIKYYIPTPTEK